MDEISAREWRNIIRECQKYREDMVSINFPAFDGKEEKTFVFAGFVKPGKHVLIIYDPKTKEFFRRDIIVEMRGKDIIVQNLSTQDQNTMRQNNSFDDLGDSFIFKDWIVDNEEFLRQLYLTDIGKSSYFSPFNIGISKDLFYKILEFIKANFKTFV